MEQSKHTFGNYNILGVKKKKEVLKGEIEASSKQEDWRTDNSRTRHPASEREDIENGKGKL